MGTNTAPNNETALRIAAYQLGRLLARSGDFYDVAEQVARGWAAEHVNPTENAASAAYSEPGKSPAVPPAFGEAKSTADQGPPAPRTEEHLRLEIAALNELQSVSWNLIRDLVDDAREDGWPWSKVGEALEISKQAAHSKFGRATKEDTQAERFAILSRDDV